MKNYSKFILLLPSILFFSCASNKGNLSDNRNLLREFAFCKCLQHSINDSNLFRNDLSLSVYQEVANYNPEVYRTVDSIAFNAAKNSKPSEIADHNGKKAVFMNCFTFYNSKSLDSLIKSMDKKRLEGW